MEQVKIPRMETIKKTSEMFGLPVHFVRDKVNNGEIVAVRAGKKYLVNVDKFAEYLNSCTVARSDESTSSEQIQKIAVGETPRVMPIPLK